MKAIISLFSNAYGGLSKETWVLSIVMFINRSGSMVLPFLSLYLTESIGFDIKKAGLIISIFGFGSMLGAFLGGLLADRFGHFWVQFLSLTITGFLFLFILLVRQFEGLAILVFFLGAISESLRPANAASIASYAQPGNLTRAFSLNRMAVNLGFSVGPAIGGILAGVSYHLLFYGDAFTCFAAGIVFYVFFSKRKANIKSRDNTDQPGSRSIWKDGYFLMFIFLTTSYAVMLFQIFTTLPLYYRDVYHLSETMIGLLIGSNGLFIFIVEMILVYKIGERKNLGFLIVSGVFLTGISYLILNLFSGVFLLFFSMILLSFAEILVMPYLATLVTRRAGKNNLGAYMGFYTFAYSVALVLAPFLGTRIIGNYGYEMLWYIMTLISVTTFVGFILLMKSDYQQSE